MTLDIVVIPTNPLNNNVILIVDEDTSETILIDPSFDVLPVLSEIKRRALNVRRILLTHGHFDHFAGVTQCMNALPVLPQLGMHENDVALMLDGGGSKSFHVPVQPPGKPDFLIKDGEALFLGDVGIETRLAPGHTSGSLIYYLPDAACAICGDVVFYHSVGRTDLSEGNHNQLIDSIHRQILTLPPHTRLIPGHGEETTVEEEQLNNPFLQ